MNENLTLSPQEWQIIQTILQQHLPNVRVWAFGSRTKGTAKRFSDLDLVILGEQPLTLTQLAQLNEAFSESDLPWRVDIVDWQRISPEFQAIIQRHYIEIQPTK